MVGTFPGSVEREVPFENSCTQGQSADVGRNSEVMPREADGLNFGSPGFAQSRNLEQANVLERYRVARSAGVDHQVIEAIFAIEQSDDFVFLDVGGHAERYVDFTTIVVAQPLE